MQENLLLGSGDTIYLSDADPSLAEEPDEVFRLDTKAFTPAGPSGDGVFRRIYLQVAHADGYRIQATPVLDGEPVEADGTQHATPRTAPSEETTVVLELPVATRATSIGLRVESVPLVAGDAYPLTSDGGFYGAFWIEGMRILFQPAPSAGL